jgi:hypothetical protein
MTNFFLRANCTDALDCPPLDLKSNPGRRPALKLHGFREDSFLDRLVDAAARPTTYGQHFLQSDELNLWTIVRRAAFDSHMQSLLIHGCLQDVYE